jgi:hypothetical protein
MTPSPSSSRAQAAQFPLSEGSRRDRATCAMSGPFRRPHNSAWEIFFLGIVCFCLAVPCLPQSPPYVPAPAAMLGNEACAKCHGAIYATYSTKPVAQRNGPAAQDFLPGEFRDPGSGVLYRVYLENGGINLARAMCLPGHGEESKAAIARVLEFNPDLSAAREMLKQLESCEVSCDVK